MEPSKRFRAGIWLMAAATAIHIIAYLVAQTEHVVDPDWPMHARFHTLQALIWIVGLDATLLVAILGPLRRMKSWALPVVAVGGVTAQGAYFASMAILPAGRPPGVAAHLFMAVLLAGFAVGFVLVWSEMRGVATDA